MMMRGLIYGLFNRLRFNQKLFLSYLIVIIIPIMVLGVYAYNQSKAMLNLQGLQGIERDVNTVTGSIDKSIERYNHMIRSIVFNKMFQKIVTNDYIDLVNLSRDLKDYLDPYFIMLMNLDKDIQKVTFYTQSRVPEYGDSVVSYKRVSEEPWYREAMKDAGPLWQYEDHSLFVTYKFPSIIKESNANIVYMRIHESSFFKNITDLAQEYGVVISDSNNRIVYANQSAKLTAVDSKEIIQLPEGTINVGQTNMILVKKVIPQANWTIYCYIPTAHLSPNAGSIINATFIVILSCIVSLLIIISIFSKTFIRRIFSLNAIMKRVEWGELDLQVRSESRDEIGELTNRFGKMLNRLNEQIDETYRSKIIQKEAELKALQSQINPHFLYNTLSFINWKAIKNDAPEISHVVTAMSKFYRTALNHGSNMISVRDELANIRSYIEIIQVMGEYSFDVEYTINDEVYDYVTLNLILQPLVENAIKHGIKQKETGKGHLHVRAWLAKGTVNFAIEDNGPGMEQGTVEMLLTMQSAGYGLKNIDERLKLRFGDKYGISIWSRLGVGTVLTLVIPQNSE